MTDYHLTCRHCGQRFLEMTLLLYHHCPALADAQNRRRRHAKRPAKGKVATKTQRLLPVGEGAR